MGLLGELPLKVAQALQRLRHVLELKQAAGEPEVSLQVGGVEVEGFEAVPEGVVVVSIPRERATVLAYQIQKSEGDFIDLL